jgi:hypothetical protein
MWFTWFQADQFYKNRVLNEFRFGTDSCQFGNALKWERELLNRMVVFGLVELFTLVDRIWKTKI